MENFKILFVDDDPDEHLFIQDAIKKVNPTILVTSVYDGAEAMDFLLAQDKFNGGKQSLPNMIITDLNMPKVTGFEFLKRISNIPELADIPVFVMSTSKDVKTKELCLELGAVKYCIKADGADKYVNVILDMLFEYVKLTNGITA